MPLQEIQSIDDPAVRRALDASNQFAERGFYQPLMPLGVAVTGGAALVRWRDMNAVLFPGAGTPVLASKFQLPPLFVSGFVGCRVLYSGALGSTNTINLFAGLTPAAIGAVPAQATTAPPLFALTPAGPAVADTLLSFDVAPTVAVDASAEVVQFKLFRTAGDAYGANDVYIAGYRPLWYPGRQ